MLCMCCDANTSEFYVSMRWKQNNARPFKASHVRVGGCLGTANATSLTSHPSTTFARRTPLGTDYLIQTEHHHAPKQPSNCISRLPTVSTESGTCIFATVSLVFILQLLISFPLWFDCLFTHLRLSRLFPSLIENILSVKYIALCAVVVFLSRGFL